jgi:hypothetical protein
MSHASSHLAAGRIRLSPLVASIALFSLICATAASPSGSDRETRCFRTSLALAAVSTPRTFDDGVEETTGPDICGSNIVANDNRSVTIAIHMHNRTGFLEGETYSA